MSAAKGVLARSATITRFAVFVRHQANTLVRLRLTEGAFVGDSGEQWLLRAFAPSCRIFVDVGANKGDWTATFLEYSPEARGYLFEPGRSALRILQSSFQAYSQLRIIDAAVSDCEGEAILFEQPGAGGMSSLVAGHCPQGPTLPSKVRVTTLDRALDDEGIDHVDFLKIDTEGFDLHVIRGARQRLQCREIDFVQFEYHAAWAKAGGTLGGALRLFTEWGYETYLLKRKGLFTVPYERYGEYFGLSNYLAVAPRRRQDVLPHVVGSV